MLGEQLIKNDRIALVELIKNSFDADATRVSVDFRNFGPNLETRPDSSIVITDNGVGMSDDTLRNAWMSPATPHKLRQKRRRATTDMGRTLQGEKGIGRFAVFKLGSAIKLTTRHVLSPDELVLTVDLSELDESGDRAPHDAGMLLDASGSQTQPSRGSEGDAGEEGGDDETSGSQESLLEELSARLERRNPAVFGTPTMPTGSQIEIQNIRSSWSVASAQAAFGDLERLQPVMWPDTSSETADSGSAVRKGAGPAAEAKSEFKVTFLADGVDLKLHDGRNEKFQAVLEQAVLKVTDGRVDLDSRVISFNLNGREVQLDIDGSEVKGLKPFRQKFGKQKDISTPSFTCGSFDFGFYVFDLTPTAPSEYFVDREASKLVRDHRIYLYRDDVRVYPYGDPEDDWLQIDAIRGTQSAAATFSNDQTVGYVSISQAHNPLLQDKTNREGLLDIGTATSDFILLIQTVLAYLRSKPYAQYAASKRRAEEKRRPARTKITEQFNQLRAGALDLQAQQAIDSLEALLNTEREATDKQIARTQELAGVGLSVEAASHDLIASGSEALRIARSVVDELRQLGLHSENVFTLATSLVQRLEFIDSRFQDVQGLFVSTRKRRGTVDVMRVAHRVRSMYESMHEAIGINFEIDESTELRASSVESAVLQTMINLVDNASYWLMDAPQPRTIRALALDRRTFALTDSGPGVAGADRPFIFDPFYSGKGEAGKGLGLYIARESGIRNAFDVDLASPTDSRILDGATFTLTFEKPE